MTVIIFLPGNELQQREKSDKYRACLKLLYLTFRGARGEAAKGERAKGEGENGEWRRG